ncbi:MAG: retroviral-like aspartic protease family protein [Gammaproteobacteria bacterium]|nr:retroviral-like aspartic protease family protein [Gammaproteobacteria bacterium]
MRKTLIVALLIFPGMVFGINFTTLPLTFSQELPSMPITIQGHTFNLLFDTGASSTTIALSPRILKKIRVHYLNSKKCFRDVVGAKHCHQRFVIPSLRLGHFTLHNVIGTRMPKLWGGFSKGFIPSAATKNGVIGLGLLKHFGLIIDYAHKRVVLSRKHTLPNNYYNYTWTRHIVFNMTYGINTTAYIDKAKLTLIWDTGAQPSSIKYSAKIKSKKRVCKSTYEKKCRYIKTNDFIINKQKLPNTWFHLTNYKIPFDGLIGSSFFKKNIIFIDFKNHEIWISNNKK